MLHACGMPAADADMIHGGGKTVGGLLMQARPCCSSGARWLPGSARGRAQAFCPSLPYPGCTPVTSADEV
jgi:hypothetical protein